MTTPPRLSSSLTPRAERAIRRASTAAVSFVAVAAAVLSFSGLHELAVQSGFHPTLAVLFPLATDVAVAAFSLAVLHHRMVGLRAWWPWLCMMLGVAVSVAGNVWAAPEDIVSRLVHAWPPIIFALSFETVTRLVRHRIAHSTIDAPVTADNPAAADSAPVAEPGDLPIPSTVRALPSEGTTQAEPPAAAAAAPQVASEPVKHAPSPEPTVAAAAPAPAPAPAPARDAAPKQETAPAPAPAAKATPAPKPEPAPAKDKAATPAKAPAAGTVREQITEILRAEPDATAAQIARDLNRDRSYVSKIVREVRQQLEQEATDTTPAAAPQPQVPEPETDPAPTPEAAAPAPEDTPAETTMSERLSAPPLAVVQAPQAENGPFETVPFPNVPASLIPVPDAKRAVYEATGENADVSADIWTRLNLPTANEATVTQAQLDEALAAVRDLAVARAG